MWNSDNIEEAPHQHKQEHKLQQVNHFLIESPTSEEVKQCLNAQENNKSPGFDKIPTEIYKTAGEKLLEQLHVLIVNIWNEEKIPQHRKN